jgi:hypothetical protein
MRVGVWPIAGCAALCVNDSETCLVHAGADGGAFLLGAGGDAGRKRRGTGTPIFFDGCAAGGDRGSLITTIGVSYDDSGTPDMQKDLGFLIRRETKRWYKNVLEHLHIVGAFLFFNGTKSLPADSSNTMIDNSFGAGVKH